MCEAQLCIFCLDFFIGFVKELGQRFYHPLFVIIKMNLIVDNLYLGDHTAATNDVYLKKYGITHVLNITRELACKFPSSFAYKQIKLDDSPDENLMDHF